VERRPLDRRRVFDLDFVNESDIHRVAVDIATTRRVPGPDLPVVVTPNVDVMVQLQSAPPDVRALVERAHWCLPDGQPLVWTSRLVRRPLAARLAGSTLVRIMWDDPEFSKLSWSVFASSDSLKDAIDSAGRRVHVVTAPPLMLEPDAAEKFAARHVAEIAAQKPRLVFVGLGYPKDLLMIVALMESWPAGAETPVFLGIGASFEMLFGLRKRAPEWIQRLGMEWFYRFVQEPRRLFVRYFVRDPAFVRIALREARRRT
jgi:N-acetylglucosaminyldiphosphoundecaprenol N-acetyl-beta-D-mannosaminyltransferase